jgi:hypothetical protein
LRWDKPPGEADRLEALEKILTLIEAGRGAVTKGTPAEMKT